jgi:hypothetical protein
MTIRIDPSAALLVPARIEIDGHLPGVLDDKPDLIALGHLGRALDRISVVDGGTRLRP